MSLTDKLSAVGPRGTDLRLHGPSLVMVRIACLGLALCALTTQV
jgi:hypothetical protein